MLYKNLHDITDKKWSLCFTDIRFSICETRALLMSTYKFLFVSVLLLLMPQEVPASAFRHVHPADDDLADTAAGLSCDDVLDLCPVGLTELLVV